MIEPLARGSLVTQTRMYATLSLDGGGEVPSKYGLNLVPASASSLAICCGAGVGSTEPIMPSPVVHRASHSAKWMTPSSACSPGTRDPSLSWAPKYGA